MVLFGLIFPILAYLFVQILPHVKKDNIYRSLVESVNGENVNLKEKFIEHIESKSNIEYMITIVDTYDKYFDIGYCGYQIAGEITWNVNRAKERAEKRDPDDIKLLTRAINDSKLDFERYNEECK